MSQEIHRLKTDLMKSSHELECKVNEICKIGKENGKLKKKLKESWRLTSNIKRLVEESIKVKAENQKLYLKLS